MIEVFVAKRYYESNVALFFSKEQNMIEVFALHVLLTMSKK